MQTKMNNFLDANGINGYTIDIPEQARIFMKEMKKGLAGQPSTLRMLPTYIETGKPIPKGERVIALDAGGTHFRAATLAFSDSGSPQIEDFCKYPMPGTMGAITAQEFFEAAAGFIEPLLGKSNKIGFCFSYPAQTTPNRDGKLLSMTKEVSISGAEGLLVGLEINQVLKRKGFRPADMTVLNDTTACLLGGIAGAARNYGGYIGFILGTGTNTCYVEQLGRIEKLYDPITRGNMIINQESGNYGLLPQGTVDAELDAESHDPGHQRLEKMVSGVYFGKILRRALEKACAAGLLSPNMETIGEFSMPDVDFFCENPNATGFFSALTEQNNQDKQALLSMIDALYERAVRVTLVQMAGILLQTDAGKDLRNPVCVVAEGSFFEKSKTFRSKLDTHLIDYLAGKEGRYCELVKVENATLAGAAAAALLSDEKGKAV